MAKDRVFFMDKYFYGRTTHSLIKALKYFNVTCVCDETLSLYKQSLELDRSQRVDYYGTIEGQRLIQNQSYRMKFDEYTLIGKSDINLVVNERNITTVKDFLDNFSEYVELFTDPSAKPSSISSCVFIRSLDGSKTVSGMVMPIGQLDILQNAIYRDLKKLPESHPIFAGRTYDLLQEVRVIYWEGKPLTASLYYDETGRSVYHYTEYNFAADEFPNITDTDEQILVVDFAKINGPVPCEPYPSGWFALERNCFWTSGMYGCDWYKIIEKLYTT